MEHHSDPLVILSKVSQPLLSFLKYTSTTLLGKTGDKYYSFINSFEENPWKQFDIKHLKVSENKLNTPEFANKAISLCCACALAYEEPERIKSVLLNTWKFGEVVVFENENEDKLVSIQAYLAYTDEVGMLIFRGTDPFNAHAWTQNLRVGLDNVDPPLSPGKVHKGWQLAVNSIWNKIEEELIKIDNKDRKFWLAGHSLGGCLASLASLRFHDYCDKSKIHEQFDGIFSFGQPLMADETFSKAYNTKLQGKVFRFHTQHDLVPTLPTPFFPHGNEYKHIGESFLLKSPEFLRSNRLKQRLLMTPALVEGMRAHLPSEYKEALHRLL